MPSLRDLSNNLPNFRYYSGVGTFSANNIPYGGDQPGGGSSNQPYIQREIGQRWSPSNVDIPFNNGVLTTTSRSAADVLRISKFLSDAPRGPLWLAKQVGLQMMNPIIQHKQDRVENKPISGQGLLNNVGNFISNTSNRIENDLGPTRIYNPTGITTLAQVAVNASGIRFNRHGILPTTKDDDRYEIEGKNSERLTNLVKKFAQKETTENYDSVNIIDRYKGGPNSFLGIGETIIKRYSKTYGMGSEENNSSFIDIPLSSVIKIESSGQLFLGNEQYTTNNNSNNNVKQILKNRNINPVFVGQSVSINNTDPNAVLMGQNEIDLVPFDFSKEDFRLYKNKINTDTNKKITSSDYVTNNIERRIGVLSSRHPSKNNPNPLFNGSGSRENYWDDGGADTVNAISLYTAQAAGDFTETVDINGNIVNKKTIRDLVKFRIKSFDNDKTDETGVYMVFRAFITGINDYIISNWTPYSYVGRGENFYAYDGFESGYNVSFKIAALSRGEMKPLYQKLNYLKSTMTPDYSKSGKMRGNVMELTIGDYIQYQPGIITNLVIDIPEEAAWEIALDYLGVDSDMHELPMLLNVSFSFIPIYRFLPRKSASKPFIGIHDYRKNYTDGTARPQRDWLVGADEKLKGANR